MTPEKEIMLPLKIATQRASMELESLHARLERLEHGLDMVFSQSVAALETESISMLQELDMLRQSVGALAEYLDQISEQTGEDGVVNLAMALHAMPLRDMATRLGGRQKLAPRAGQAELF
jgi:hypothetical protein